MNINYLLVCQIRHRRRGTTLELMYLLRISVLVLYVRVCVYAQSGLEYDDKIGTFIL